MLKPADTDEKDNNGKNQSLRFLLRLSVYMQRSVPELQRKQSFRCCPFCLVKQAWGKKAKKTIGRIRYYVDQRTKTGIDKNDS